jgi:adenine phosphoribosyltransferase
MGVDELKAKIRDVPDWPQEGVIFRDITPLLADRESLKETIDLMAQWAEPRRPELVVGGEARGFFVGAALAYRLGCGFVPARRPGKLPLETISAEYALEYGTNALELHSDALAGCSRVLLHDDVLATGGTSKAMAGLVEQLGGEVVGITYIIELDFLSGREQLADYDLFSLSHY